MKNCIAAGVLLASAGLSLAQEKPAAPEGTSSTAPVPALCSKVVKVTLPSMNFSGFVKVAAEATVKNGRIVAVNYRSLTSGVERRALRTVQNSIDVALRQYSCETDGTFKQEFSFLIE